MHNIILYLDRNNGEAKCVNNFDQSFNAFNSVNTLPHLPSAKFSLNVV